MIQTIAKKSLVMALLAGIGFAATAQERVYVIDQRDIPVGRVPDCKV